MADSNEGGSLVLGFLLGGVMVVVAVIGFFMWDNYKSHTVAATPGAKITLNVKKG